MSEMDKYYQILGLNPGASDEEIKQAYKDLVNVWHPDRFLNNARLRQKADEKLKEINEAYGKLKSYLAEGSNYASSEGYAKSQPPPREPPPKSEKMEREKSSTTGNGGYGESKPPPTNPPPKADGARALWNPNAAANWSLPFTPAFGSYLQMLNWRSLNEPARASSAQSWFHASLLMLFIYFLIGIFVSDAERRYSIIWWLSFLYLITWYLGSGRSQVKYVKAKFGKNYPKKPWGQALLIAAGALVGCWMIAFALGFLLRSVTTQPTPEESSCNDLSKMRLNPLFESIGKSSGLDPLYEDIDSSTAAPSGYDPLGLGPEAAKTDAFYKHSGEDLVVGNLDGYEEKVREIPFFIITGAIKNQSEFAKKFIRLRVMIYDRSQHKLAEKEAICGRVIRREELKNLPLEFFRRDVVVTPRTEQEMITPPGRITPFMVIFRDPPVQAKEFTVDILEAPNL